MSRLTVPIAVLLLLTVAVASSQVAVAAGHSSVVRIYWSDSGTVNRANPDGTGQMLLAVGFSRVNDVEIDQVAGQLYWNNWIVPPAPGEGIYRSALDGTGAGLFTSATTSPTGFPHGLHGIEVDGAGGVVYFTRGVSYGNPAEVSKINTNGLGYTPLFGGPNQGWFPSGITVDTANGIVYWGDPGVIFRPPNGAINSMTTAGVGPAIVSPHVDGRGRSLAFDANLGLLFVSSFDWFAPFRGGAIHSYDIANNILTLIYSDPSTGIPDLEVDPSAMRVYFTDYANGKISSVDYSGAGMMDHIVGLNNPFGLDLELRMAIDVDLDIKPTSCPNPLNVNSRGRLPVAVLGSASLDVNDIDVSTVALEGVAPEHSAIEDVAGPFAGTIQDPPQRDDCTTDGPDGFDDLTLKFDTRDVVAALGGAGALTDGDVLVLTLTGKLTDGTNIEGVDVVWIKKKGN